MARHSKESTGLVIEEALEAEVADTLGRGYYDRAEFEQGERAPGGHRNGYRVGKLDSMVDPIAVITDGAPGLIRAAEEVFLRSMRQRCLAHKMRNLLSNVPEERSSCVLPAARAAYQAPSVALARLAEAESSQELGARVAKRVGVLRRRLRGVHRTSTIAHCASTRDRTTNLLERLFGEERRRTKTIPHAFGERAVMKLMYAALIRASQMWRGVAISEFERRQLDTLRAELDQTFNERHAVPLKPASRPRNYSNNGT